MLWLVCLKYFWHPLFNVQCLTTLSNHLFNNLVKKFETVNISLQKRKGLIIFRLLQSIDNTHNLLDFTLIFTNHGNVLIVDSLTGGWGRERFIICEWFEKYNNWIYVNVLPCTLCIVTVKYLLKIVKSSVCTEFLLLIKQCLQS